MILVLSGTREAREAIHLLQEQGYPILATTVGSYARELIRENDDVAVREGALSAGELEELLIRGDVSLVVDATHPFAVRISQLAMEICGRLQVPYLRFERAGTILEPDAEGIIRVNTMEEAATVAAAEAQVKPVKVFLTVGSNQLEIFCRMLPLECLVARVLPQSGVLEKCEALGLQPKQIVALQGPFDKKLNRELFRHYRAGVVVTKDSGPTGGVGEKIEAARELEIPVIVVSRPALEYPLVAREGEELLRLANSLCRRKEK